MQQGNSTHINNKKTEEVGPISFDETWKAVGSLSRRGSLAPTLNGNTSNKHSPAASPTPNSSIIPARRSSLDPIQWGYFGGFQWETTGLFNNETRKSSFSHPTAVTMDGPTLHQRPSYDNILSVPMLPGVSMEPIYRQQRSLSFSVGQDPTFFGHNDNVSNDLEPYGYKNSLAIMEEEEHEDMIQDMINQESNSARWRARSQSSGAVFGLMAISQQNNLLSRRRGSEQHDDLTLQQRRSSRFFGGMDGSTHLPVAGALSDQSTCASMTMMNQKQLDGMQRRSSLSHGREYIFPDQSYNLLQQRRQSRTQQAHHPHHIQQLSEKLENTNLRQNDSIHTPLPGTTYKQQVGNNYMIQQPEEYIDTSSQHQTRHTISPNSIFQDTGKGIPLPRLPHSIPLYAVEFKAGRMDYFYVASEPRIPGGQFQVGDLVIVEGDRGKDLGKVAIHNLTIDMVDQLITQKQQQDDIKHEHKPKDTYIKRLYRLATRNEIDLLVGKEHDEKMALEHCQRKTKMYQLPMIVVDAEYQWDRRKLTFFFVSNRRIDFRELVRELFKHYKARIWMCASNSNTTLPPHTLPS